MAEGEVETFLPPQRASEDDNIEEFHDALYCKTDARLWHLFPLIVLEVIGLTVLVPFLPKVYSEFFDNNMQYVYWAAGGTMALNSFLTFSCASTIGKLSDAYGRKPFLLIAVTSSHIPYLVLTFDGNLWLYFGLLAFSGCFAVSIAITSSYVGDVCAPRKRTVAFGQVVGMLGFGGLIGIGLGGILPYHTAKWLPLFLVATNTCYTVSFLHESLHPEDRVQVDLGDANPFKTLGYINKTPLVQKVATMTFLATVAQNGIQDTILFYLRNHRGFEPPDIALFLLVAMGVTIMLQWVGLPILEKNLSYRAILVLALTCSACAIGLYALATERWQFYCIVVLSAFGFLTFTVGLALISNEADLSTGKSDSGVLQGAFSGLNKFATGVGPLVFNTLAGATTTTFPLAPFLLGFCVALSALLFAFRIEVSTPPIQEREGEKIL